MELHRTRPKESGDFASYYESLCAQEGKCPVAPVRSGAKEGVLNCPLRRLRDPDWGPLLAALRANRTLHTVAFHQRWEDRLYPAASAGVDCRGSTSSDKRKRPSVEATVSSIVSSVQQCLCVSTALKSLTLQGVRISMKDCKCLAKGLSKTPSLTHLSLKGSNIGDGAAEVICNALKNSSSLVWLDLTACGLATRATETIARLIKTQCLSRQNLAWKDSLRSGHAPLPRGTGLHRVTLNVNPGVGDSGAAVLAEALRDDVCLKALDVQTCGISSEGARTLQDMVLLNSTLIVLDLRANPLIDDAIVADIHQQLSRSVARMSRQEEPYMWLEVQVEQMARDREPPQQSRRPRVPTSKSVPDASRRQSERSKSGRANSGWGIPPHQRVNQSPRSSRHHTKVTDAGVRPSSHTQLQPAIHVAGGSGGADGQGQRTSPATKETPCPHLKGTCRSGPLIVNTESEEVKRLELELFSCQERLKMEMSKRKQLEAENCALREKLERFKYQQSVAGNIPEGHSELFNVSSYDDDVLAAVEAAFKQFHAFLDLLTEQGTSMDRVYFRRD